MVVAVVSGGPGELGVQRDDEGSDGLVVSAEGGGPAAHEQEPQGHAHGHVAPMIQGSARSGGRPAHWLQPLGQACKQTQRHFRQQHMLVPRIEPKLHILASSTTAMLAVTV